MDFDYKIFAEDTAKQVWSSIPADINYNNKTHLVKTIQNYIKIIFETEDDNNILTENHKIRVSQIIAQLLTQKGIEVYRAKINNNSADEIFRNLAFVVYDIYKQSVQSNSSEVDLKNLINDKVSKSYTSTLNSLYTRRSISKKNKVEALFEADEENINFSNQEEDDLHIIVNDEYYKELTDKIVNPIKKMMPYDISYSEREDLFDQILFHVNDVIKCLCPENKIYFSKKHNEFICELLANHLFCVGVDIARAHIPEEFRGDILYNILSTVYNMSLRGVMRHWESDRIVDAIEYSVNKTYSYEINKLYREEKISEDTKSFALTISMKDTISSDYYSNFADYVKHSDNDLFRDYAYATDEKILSEDTQTGVFKDLSKDRNILKDRVLESYKRQFAYKNLFKISHLLKRNDFEVNDRKMILRTISFNTNRFIEWLDNEERISLTEENSAMLITYFMDLLFQKLIPLNSSHIHPACWDEILLDYSDSIYQSFITYTYDKRESFEIYHFAKKSGFNKYSEILRNFYNSKRITKDNYIKAKQKCYLKLFDSEITVLEVEKKKDTILKAAVVVLKIVIVAICIGLTICAVSGTLPPLFVMIMMIILGRILFKQT